MVNIDRIKNLRIALSQDQIDVANALNLSREAYCMYENGLRNPSYETLVLMARYYNVSLDYLFGLTDNPVILDDFSNQERYIVKNIHETSPDVLNALCTIIKIDRALRDKSINS